MRPYSLGAKFRRQAAQGTVRIRSHVLDSGHLAHLCLVSPVHVVLWKSVSFPRMPADVGGGHAASCQRVCRILEIRPGKRREMVGAHGLGPWTSSLSETRSNHLSYAPGVFSSPVPGAPREEDSAMRCALPGSVPPKGGAGLLLVKEVIQPQVPLRLPCYDFIPVTGTCLDALRRLR